MKYIKLYEEIDKDSVIYKMQTIRDILLEVEDIGYETIVSNNYLAIQKWNNNFNDAENKINFGEVKDCLLRLKDYLGGRYISCSIFCSDPVYAHGTKIYVTEWKQIRLDENININSSTEIRKIGIFFYSF
jgi:hypothetical protein